MKELMVKAHKMTRGIKEEFPEVDYMAQLGICISYLMKGEDMSKRADEIKEELNVSDEEAILLEEVESYYQKEESRDSKIEMSLWEKGNMRRVYIKCPWRCKNQNGKGNYFDLNLHWLSDRSIGRQF
ncbi:hypothetical protein [Clostridium sp. HBUAS56017]|uniref:hypothetical protein n=1 Tax=Clostridium sp. HBUAS56017 TaxID=2571128 RepID=UPI001177F1B5|nr:hypothetical protein [Clostridium sp. HBUAS56017]